MELTEEKMMNYYIDNKDDYTINLIDAKKRISSNTSAIIAVHLYGHPCEMDELIKYK